MANDINDPVSKNVEGVSQLVNSKINKIPGKSGPGGEGPVGEKIDILDLPKSDEELLSLAQGIENKYKTYYGKIEGRQKKNLEYYLGVQKENMSSATDGQVIASNVIFDAEEVFLAAALAKNPDPVVYADNTDEGNKVADDVKTMLQYHADAQNLRPKLTLMTRNWTLDLLSVMKHGWDESGDIKCEVRDVKKFIFDSDGYVDSYGDFVGVLGEKISSTAQELSDMFPKFSDLIAVLCEGKMGTTVIRTEWWNDEYTFTTFKGKVLDKSKNPHFNYEEGQRNHFARPKKPYSFLSVFSVQTQPYDLTGLIEQVIPSQNRITRRTVQLDYNLSRSNNSDVFSASNFNQETAKQAAEAMRKGNPIIVPEGRTIAEAINRLQAPTVGSEFFTALENDKGDARSIYGVQGITAQPQNEDQTARGMILNQQYDNSRIGGGIGDRLEVTAKNIFNQWVQFYYVYYDEQHFANVMGKMKATEYVLLSSQDLTRSVTVSVAPDSMKGKDEITEINNAINFFKMGAIGPKTLLTIANFPSPDEAAADGLLFKLNPQLYMQLNFPEMAAQLQALGQEGRAAQGQPQPQDGGEPEQPAPEGTSPATQASPSLSQVPLP